MWLFTKYGFFSAVRNMDNPGLTHVRARFKGDLSRLIAYAYGHRELKGVLSPKRPVVRYTPRNDYAWRADFPKADFAAIVAATALEIDYTNFKNAAHCGTLRDNAYMRVWGVMSSAQHQSLNSPAVASQPSLFGSSGHARVPQRRRRS